MKYTVLTFNIGGYEALREIQLKSSDAEYIYVTDDKSTSSKTWDIRYCDNPYPEDKFHTCFQIRYNPFNYASSDVVLRMDSSLQILGPVDEIIDYFNRGQYDICLLAHPKRQTLSDEYKVWCETKGYSLIQADRIMAYTREHNYDPCAYKGLFQSGFVIQRRNAINEELNQVTWSLVQELAEEGKQVDRLDQTLFSYVINTRFEHRLKVMIVDERILHSRYFRRYMHGTWDEAPFNGLMVHPYLFNRPVKAAKLNYRAKAHIYKWWLPRPVVLALNVVKKMKDSLLRRSQS